MHEDEENGLDEEFITKVKAGVKSGLEQFFGPGCVVESCYGIMWSLSDACVHSLTVWDRRENRAEKDQLCTVAFLNECAVVGEERHDYCHPEFPDTLLFAIDRATNRTKRFDFIKSECVDIADYDPDEALSNFVKSCEADILLERAIQPRISEVLKMRLDGTVRKKQPVIDWINSCELPKIEEYVG